MCLRGKTEPSMPKPCGISSAPNAPWTSRATMIEGGSQARPQASEAAVKPVMPIRKVRRRPYLSPSRPPVTSSTPRASAWLAPSHLIRPGPPCNEELMVGAAMVVIVASSRSMMSATRTMPRTSHAATGSLDAPSAGLEDTRTVIRTSYGGLGCTAPLGSRGGSSSGADRLKRLPAVLGWFGVLGLFCGGSGLPGEVAVGEGAACGQNEGGDGQGEGVAVVKGAGGGVQEGAGLAGGEAARAGAVAERWIVPV